MNCKYYRIRTKKGVHYKYCILNKEIIQDDCYNCINKEYKEVKYKKKLSTFHVHKHKSTKAKNISKLERNRFSIFTTDLSKCIICGNQKDNLHEVLYGKNRLKSMEYGFVIPLCFNHHIGNNGIHFNRKLDLYYKRRCQIFFEENIGKRDDFIKIFGRSYL